MPEGHVIHHHARRLSRAFSRRAVRIDSPQGRFADGAASVNGRIVRRVEAHGKHLFIGFDNNLWIRVHLGLFGKWRIGSGDAPDVVGQVRLRIRTDEAFAELRGPTVCEVFTIDEKRVAVRPCGPTWSVLMSSGTRRARIDTVRPEHMPEAMGRPPRQDRHGGEVYVYRRDGMPCLICATEVQVADLQGRRLYWCPTCQAH
jgi:formamidopyrimidine-DNA glycosylase